MIRSKSYRRFQIIAHLVLVLTSALIILPFILLIMSSFTEEQTIIRNGYAFFPQKLSLDAYNYIFRNAETIFRAYGMTILVTAVGTTINMILAVLMAYPLAVKKLPGRKIINFYVFFTMLFNGGLVPTYIMYTNYFNIKNTIWALIVPTFMLSAMNVLLIRTYIANSIPEALFESARIDGAGQFSILINIVLPLGKPIIVTMGLFSGLGYWNDWTNGLYYITESKLYSIQVLLNNMIANLEVLRSNTSLANTAGIDPSEIPSAGVRMAIALVAMIPIIIIFPFVQKFFQKGITLGAVKG